MSSDWLVDWLHREIVIQINQPFHWAQNNHEHSWKWLVAFGRTFNKKKKKYTNWKWWWFYKWIVHVLINKREIRVASVCWAQNTNKRSRKKKTTTANDRLHAAIRQPNRVDKHSIVYCSGLWWSCLLYILFFDWHNSQCECNIDFDLRISIADVAVTTEQAQLRISWGQSHSISIVVAHFNCKKKKM